MKPFFSIIIISLTIIACTSQRKQSNKSDFNVQFEYKNQKAPFETCATTDAPNLSLTFKDTANTFTTKVDSNWTYKYTDPDQGTMVHTFHQPNDTNLKLVIVVDEELFTQKQANQYFKSIFPQENLKSISFAKDSCKWHTFYSKNKFNNGNIKHVSHSTFYYYHKSSKRFYTIVIGEEKITKSNLTKNFACLFQESIQSFTPLN
jgi:hypothetical protein|tara:strand:- start:171 stop:782 length:612 start_codon:yes stop_codon:yes gene_type:complete